MSEIGGLKEKGLWVVEGVADVEEKDMDGDLIGMREVKRGRDWGEFEERYVDE